MSYMDETYAETIKHMLEKLAENATKIARTGISARGVGAHDQTVMMKSVRELGSQHEEIVMLLARWHGYQFGFQKAKDL